MIKVENSSLPSLYSGDWKTGRVQFSNVPKKFGFQLISCNSFHFFSSANITLHLDAVASIARFEHKIQKSEVICNRTRVRCIQST